MSHIRVLSRNALRATLDRVDEAEFHRRLDAHMERGNAHMERGNAHMERGNELMGRLDVAFAENTRAFNHLSRVLHLEELALRRLLRDFELHSQDVRAEMRDVRAEMRAGREALFRMLDRFDGRGGEAPG
jgi:hypothetical protein